MSKPILISHRGNLEGPNSNLENKPSQILKVIELGFNCEIDIWLKDHDWYLGHDQPQYKILNTFLLNSGLWLHCKNIQALTELNTYHNLLNYFWHQEDQFTLTSQGKIWAYPQAKVIPNSICVLPEKYGIMKENIPADCIGICSDYIYDYKEKDFNNDSLFK